MNTSDIRPGRNRFPYGDRHDMGISLEKVVGSAEIPGTTVDESYVSITLHETWEDLEYPNWIGGQRTIYVKTSLFVDGLVTLRVGEPFEIPNSGSYVSGRVVGVMSTNRLIGLMSWRVSQGTLEMFPDSALRVFDDVVTQEYLEAKTWGGVSAWLGATTGAPLYYFVWDSEKGKLAGPVRRVIPLPGSGQNYVYGGTQFGIYVPVDDEGVLGQPRAALYVQGAAPFCGGGLSEPFTSEIHMVHETNADICELESVPWSEWIAGGTAAIDGSGGSSAIFNYLTEFPNDLTEIDAGFFFPGWYNPALSLSDPLQNTYLTILSSVEKQGVHFLDDYLGFSGTPNSPEKLWLMLEPVQGQVPASDASLEFSLAVTEPTANPGRYYREIAATWADGYGVVSCRGTIYTGMWINYSNGSNFNYQGLPIATDGYILGVNPNTHKWDAIPNPLPDGSATGDVLTWDGEDWYAAAVAGLPNGTTDGDILVWDSVTETWEAQAHEQDTLPDGQGAGQVLTWDGSTWYADNPPTVGLMDGSEQNQVLIWDVAANEWISGPVYEPAPIGSANGDIQVWDNANLEWTAAPFPIPNGDDYGDVLYWETTSGNGAWAVKSAPIEVPAGTAERETLLWDNTNKLWKNQTFPVPNGTAAGQMLLWNGSVWTVEKYTVATGASGLDILRWSTASSSWTATPMPTVQSGTATGQLLQWNNSTKTWVAGTTGSVSGQILKWLGGATGWTASTGIPDGTATGQLLQWNNSTKAWTAGTSGSATGQLLTWRGGSTGWTSGLAGSASGQLMTWLGGTTGWTSGIAGTATGQLMAWDNTAKAWSAGLTGAATGQALKWLGGTTGWSAATLIPDGTATGQLLKWDVSSTSWVAGLTGSATGQLMKWYGGTTGWSAATVIPDGTATGQLLKWDATSTSWVAGLTGSATGQLMKWLGGTTGWTAAAVIPDGTATGQLLKWDATSSAWVAGLTGSATGQLMTWQGETLGWTSGLAGSATGQLLQWNNSSKAWAVGLAGSVTGQALKWLGGSTGWTAATLIPDGTATGQLLKWDATSSAWVAGLTGSAAGQALKWFGGTTGWSAATLIPDGTATGQLLKWDNSSKVWVAGLTGTATGQALKWYGGTTGWSAATLIPDGTATGQLLKWDNSSKVWAAGLTGSATGQVPKWFGGTTGWSAATLVPDGTATGQLLKWDNSSKVWVAGLTGSATGQAMKWFGGTTGWSAATLIPEGTATGQMLQWNDGSKSWTVGLAGSASGQVPKWLGGSTGWTAATLIPDGTATGQLLKWDNSSKVWVAGLTGTATGQALKWYGGTTGWSAATVIPDGTATGQLLKWDVSSTSWVAGLTGSTAGQVLTWFGGTTGWAATASPMPTGADKNTMYYDGTTGWTANGVVKWSKLVTGSPSSGGVLQLDLTGCPERAWDAAMPGFAILHPSGGTCGIFANIEAGANGGSRLDMGWGGANGGNFELYSNSHPSRPGEFRIVYGPSGHVEYKNYRSGTDWRVTSGLSKEGRFFCGFNDAQFPGVTGNVGTNVAPVYPLQIFNETSQDSKVVAGVSKEGRGFFGCLGNPATGLPAFPLEIYNESGATASARVAGISKNGRAFFGVSGSTAPTPEHPLEIYNESGSTASARKMYVTKDGKIVTSATVGSTAHTAQLDCNDIAMTTGATAQTVKLREMVMPYKSGAAIKGKLTQVMCGAGYGDELHVGGRPADPTAAAVRGATSESDLSSSAVYDPVSPETGKDGVTVYLSLGSFYDHTAGTPVLKEFRVALTWPNAIAPKISAAYMVEIDTPEI